MKIRSLRLLVLAGALALSAGETLAGNQAFCGRYFADHGQLTEFANQIQINDSIPEIAEPIESYVILSLIKADGSPLVPISLAESNCHLMRVLPKDFIQAVDRGAREAARRNTGTGGGRDIDRLFESVDSHLNELYVKHGMPPGTGFLRMRGFLGSEYGFERWSDELASPIQRSLRAQGICETNAQLTYVLLSFVASRGVNSYSPERFAADLRREGGCPNSQVQTARECSELGGQWRRACPGKHTRCFVPYTDGGKNCSDSSECEGECIVEIFIRCDGIGNCEDPPDVPEPGTLVMGTCQTEIDECSSLVIVKDGRAQKVIHQD